MLLSSKHLTSMYEQVRARKRDQEERGAHNAAVASGVVLPHLRAQAPHTDWFGQDWAPTGDGHEHRTDLGGAQ